MNEANRDLLNEINVAAYFIAKESHPYDTLCWFLAEREIIFKNPEVDPPDPLVKQRAAQIYFEGCPYDILTWRIAELDILIKHGRFETE